MSERVEEIEELASGAGFEIVCEIIQRRGRPDPTTFLGKGKMDEINDFLSIRRFDALIINGDLKPTHHYILENTFKVECVDRLRLVLELFTLRASSKESKLQVERARLQYEIPLIREWIHSAKMGEHPGFLGGGEYAVDVYYDLIKKRMRKIDEELRRLGEANNQRRVQRKRKGFYLISLAGYTNAGKSSLMKALTDEDVLIENRLFSTLTTTTKRMASSPLPILITDTIGFLNDLPHFVIEAFKNTITEIFSADLILLVIDASEDMAEIDSKFSTSKNILMPEVGEDRIFLILNKIDRLDVDEQNARLEKMKNEMSRAPICLVSAVEGGGVENLKTMILNRFSYPLHFSIILPQTGETERFLAKLREEAEVCDLDYSNVVRVKGSCKATDSKRIQEEVMALRGKILFDELQ